MYVYMYVCIEVTIYASVYVLSICMYCANLGYHGTLAASFGLHHLLHYFDWKGNEELNALKVATEAKQFYSFLHPNESSLQ